MIALQSSQATLPRMVGVREFSRGMGSLKKTLIRQPLMVLKNNRPDFIALHPATYQRLIAAFHELRDARLYEDTIRARASNKKISWRAAKKRLGL